MPMKHAIRRVGICEWLSENGLPQESLVLQKPTC